MFLLHSEGFFFSWRWSHAGWVLWVGCDWSFLITTLPPQTCALGTQFSSSPVFLLLPADCKWKLEYKCAPPLMMCFWKRKKRRRLLSSCFSSERCCWFFRTVWSPVACRGRIFYIHSTRSTRTTSRGETRTCSTLSSMTTQVHSCYILWAMWKHMMQKRNEGYL